MKVFSPRYIAALTALLAIPFIYNSCQGGLLGAKGFSSSKSSTCKVAIENGVVKKLEFVDNQTPAVFASTKVRLRAESSSSAQNKAAAPVMVNAGTKLGVLMDNRCLQDHVGQLSASVISSAVSRTGEYISELDKQVYLWELERNYADNDIEEIARTEPCVIGISWNQEYKVQATFSDVNQSNQTHLNSIRALTAYDAFYNSGGGMETTGNPVIVAVVDTGVDWQHPDLEANIWKHQSGAGIDITTVGGTGAVDYNPLDVSDIGHGTHVAGLIGAVSNNGLGIIGTMPYRVKIMAIKLFKLNTDGTLSTSSQYFYNAVRFAYLNGANVINLSLGAVGAGQKTDSLADTAIQEALARGVVVTVVIGNAEGGANGQIVDGVNFSSIPGQFATRNGVIGVGSFDVNTGAKSYFSHFSTNFVEIAAPGAQQGNTGIYSTIPRNLGNYGQLAGTSQAGPIVSAAAALTIGIIRDATGVAPTPTEVERLILASAVKSPTLNTYFKDGNKLDLLNLVQKINQEYPQTANGGGGGSTVIPDLVGCAK